MEALVSTEPTLLSNKAVYQIKGTLYAFLYRETEGRSPKFVFRPLGGQRKTAELRLTAQKIYIHVKEVKSLYGQSNSKITGSYTQLALW